MNRSFIRPILSFVFLFHLVSQAAEKKMNVLFIIADDLTARSLSCYENKACQTPNIDLLASQGIRYTKAYCQFPVCGPSRASMMSGYYPDGSGAYGYDSGRKQIGERSTWTQYFKAHDYHTARVSKIFHMAVPRDIVNGGNGTDDPRSWSERFNSKGPEMFAPGEGEMLEKNPDGKLKIKLGNFLQYVKADGDDLVHSDAKTAQKACELLRKYKATPKQPFFLAVGMVRPHVPFVAPRSYFKPYPVDSIVMPEKVENDQDDIPKKGMGQFTSKQAQLTPLMEKKAVSGYYASVAYMDAQVGKILSTLKELEMEDNTIVIFTSDHGYHIGEHEFWMKTSLHEESSRVPLIIKVPGKKAAVCESLAELVDLYPTVSEACGLEIPANIQGKSLIKTFDNPKHQVRKAAYSINGRSNGRMIRTDDWAYIRYAGKNGGAELYDMVNDPQQYTNLVDDPKHQKQKALMDALLTQRVKEATTSDVMKEKKGKVKK